MGTSVISTQLIIKRKAGLAWLLLVLALNASADEAKDLFAAAANGQLARVQNLLAQGVSANSKIEQDRTPLMAACFNGNLRIVKTLLGYGADVNQADKQGSTALVDAIQFGNPDLVNVLIAAGANVNAEDAQKVKILDKAKKQPGREAIVKLLEAAGAKATEPPAEGEEGGEGGGETASE